MDLDFFAEEDLSPLQYARHHGLCSDFSQEKPDIKSFLPPPVDQLELGLDDIPEAAITNKVHELTKERLAVSKDAALLLKTVLSLQQLTEESKQTSRPWKLDISLKQEVPILRTDPELDLRNFGRRYTPNLTNLHIPLECGDEEKDEGLLWPSMYYDYPSICYGKAKAEKFPVSKDVLSFLQDAIRDVWTPEDLKSMGGNITRKQNPALIPVTPPLLPLSSPIALYIPSSPDNHLQMLSDDSKSTAAELKVLDQQIMKEDSLVPALNTEISDDSMLLEDALSFYPFDDQSPGEPPSPITKRKQSDLQVEAPLTPDMSSESPMKKIKSVTFKEMVAEFIPELPSTADSGNDYGHDNSFAGFFKTATPLLAQVEKMISNEKLSEADTTKRVDVPDVDFTLPTAPWIQFSRANIGQRPDEKLELEAQRRFIIEIKRNELKFMPSWHRMSKPEREMEWSPFPTSMDKITIEEKLHGEEVLGNILAELSTGDIATSSTDIWKRDGLKILEDNITDEEELEVAIFEESRTLETLAKKRKLEIDDQSTKLDFKIRDLNTETAVEWCRGQEQISTPQHQTTKRKQEPQKTKNNSYLMFGGTFSATSALQNFIEAHCNATPIQPTRCSQTSARLLDTVPPPAILPVHSTGDRSVTVTGASRIAEVGRDGQSKHVLPLPPLPPLPANPEQLAPASFIISSTLLQQRRLTREIHKIYPNAEMVERDFGLLYSPAAEADLLLSPSTGLIVTTLQQIKQRALPGQKNTSPIKERIFNLQRRFERLVVLIGEGLSRDAEQSGCGRPVDSRDQAALVEFEKSTSLMEAEITNQFIRGGELALASAIVWEMAKWGLPHGSTDVGELRLLQDETYWELFLRRAGLNTYASQIILASLKIPYDMPLASICPNNPNLTAKAAQVFGLPAFILMSAEERITKFQVQLGGSRIIGRVNNLLDQEWPSAAHGFKI